MSDDGEITREQRLDVYREKADDVDKGARYQARAVLSLLQKQLKKHSDMIARSEELSIASEVLVDIAEENDAHTEIIEYGDEQASEIASAVQYDGDNIRAGYLTALRESHREVVMAEADEKADGGSWSLETGTGVDEYIEENIESVTKLTTTDHVDDVTVQFSFGDVYVEFENGEHLTFPLFYAALETATDEQIRDEIASLQAAQYLEGDITEDGTDAKDKFRDMSLGPRERPWSFENWNECITHIVDSHSTYTSEDEQPTGPRTEAWEHIQDEIRHGRATSNRADAVDHKAVYVPEDLDEVWVPTTIVDNACDDIAVTRKTLVTELDIRDVGTDEISGRGISDPVTERGVSLRMWRFDTTHTDVPVPQDVQASLSAGGFDNLPGGDGSAAATATDGGQFGRDPDGDDDDEGDVTNDDAGVPDDDDDDGEGDQE